MKFLRDIIEEKRAARTNDDVPPAPAFEPQAQATDAPVEALANGSSDVALSGASDEMDFDLKSFEPTRSYDDDEGWVGAEAPDGAAIGGDLNGLHDMFADGEEADDDAPGALNLQGFEVKDDAANAEELEEEAEAAEPSLSDALEAALADLETLQIEAEPSQDAEASFESNANEVEMAEESAEIEEDHAFDMSDDTDGENAVEADEATEDQGVVSQVSQDSDQEHAENELDAVTEPEVSAMDASQPEAEASVIEVAEEIAPEVEAVTEALQAEEAEVDTTEQIEDTDAAREQAEEKVEVETAGTPIAVPLPAAGRGSGRSGRVKTRILGFSTPATASEDPFEKAGGKAQPTEASASFPVGWLVVIDGPGRGTAFTIFDGVTQIGRGEDQTVRLDFGDNSISRENHAAIAYDCEQQTFFIGHGGKANLVRVNNRPVLSTEELQSDDKVRIGETTLRFVAFCGASFSWDRDEDLKHASAQ